MSATPTTYFPDHLVQWGWTLEREYGVAKVKFDAGTSQAVRLYPKVCRKASGTVFVYNNDPAVADENIRILRDFLDARYGPLEPFWIFIWKYNKFVDFSLGTGYDLAGPIVTPFKPATGIAYTATLKKNGTPTASTFDTGGSGGEIRITAITGGVLVGDTVSVSLTARERVPVELDGNTVRSVFSVQSPESYQPFDLRVSEVWTAAGF